MAEESKFTKETLPQPEQNAEQQPQQSKIVSTTETSPSQPFPIVNRDDTNATQEPTRESTVSNKSLSKENENKKPAGERTQGSGADDDESVSIGSDVKARGSITNKPNKQRVDLVVEIEKPLVAVDSFTDSESMHSEDSITSYILQKSLVSKPDFFEILGEIPSVTQISLDPSLVETVCEIPEITEADDGADKGHFVNPLTGEEEVEAQPPPPPPEPEPEPVEEQEDQEDEDESFEDQLLPAEVEEDVPVEKFDENGLDLWYTIEPPKKVRVAEEVDYEAILRMENERRNQEIAGQLLDELIAVIVEKCEYVDPNTILRQNLDKVKLMEELNSKLGDLEVEQKARFFLNRKTVEYFRRKKAFRSIVEDNPDTITQAIDKYKEATTTLDQLLGREEETRNAANFKIEELEGQVFDMQELSKASIQQFEELVRKTLLRDTFTTLPVVIDTLLRRIATQREEISKLRLVLIQRQHTFSKLIEKSNKLENIGDGLLMRDYDHLQTETLAMSKKIEERNTELNKLRTRCNAELHIMSHLKEKQQMLRNSIGIQEFALRELLDEKQSCRENLYELKMARSKIHKQIRELSFQGGLIDKPALMLDYDETVARLEVMRVKVEQKRQKFSDIQQRIRAIEEEYLANSSENTTYENEDEEV